MVWQQFWSDFYRAVRPASDAQGTSDLLELLAGPQPLATRVLGKVRHQKQSHTTPQHLGACQTIAQELPVRDVK